MARLALSAHKLNRALCGLTVTAIQTSTSRAQCRERLPQEIVLVGMGRPHPTVLEGLLPGGRLLELNVHVPQAILAQISGSLGWVPRVWDLWEWQDPQWGLLGGSRRCQGPPCSKTHALIHWSQISWKWGIEAEKRSFCCGRLTYRRRSSDKDQMRTGCYILKGLMTAWTLTNR